MKEEKNITITVEEALDILKEKTTTAHRGIPIYDLRRDYSKNGFYKNSAGDLLFSGELIGYGFGIKTRTVCSVSGFDAKTPVAYRKALTEVIRLIDEYLEKYSSGKDAGPGEGGSVYFKLIGADIANFGAALYADSSKLRIVSLKS